MTLAPDDPRPALLGLKPREPVRDKYKELIERSRVRKPNYEEDFEWVYANICAGQEDDYGKIRIDPELMPDMDNCPSIAAWTLFDTLLKDKKERGAFLLKMADKYAAQVVKRAEETEPDEVDELDRRFWKSCGSTLETLEKFVPPGEIVCPHCGEAYRFPKKDVA